MRPLPGVRITLITRDLLAPYSGMLPGFVAGHYTRDECHIDLAVLAAFAGARLYHGKATALDTAARRISCEGRPPVLYDLLSINVGSSPRQSGVPGALDHATPVKPVDAFVARWDQLVSRFANGERKLRIGVVGGGAGGVELVLAMQYRLRQLAKDAPFEPELTRFVLITAGRLLASHPAQVRRILTRTLAERRIEVRADEAVVKVEPDGVLCGNGRHVPLDAVFWVTEGGAAPWLGAAGLATDSNGFVRVGETLQTLTDPRIFAAGDIAAVEGHPRPKAGVFAVRQGEVLAENLRRVLQDRTPKRIRPQRRFLSLISTADCRAVASRGSWALAGHWVWLVKDWIDRRFVRKYSELPPTPPSA